MFGVAGRSLNFFVFSASETITGNENLPMYGELAACRTRSGHVLLLHKDTGALQALYLFEFIQHHLSASTLLVVKSEGDQRGAHATGASSSSKVHCGW